MLITYKTQNSKMHVEPNEGVLNEQHFFFSRQILNLNFGMYGCLKGRTSRKTSKMQSWLTWIAVRRKRNRNYLLGTTFDYDKG